MIDDLGRILLKDECCGTCEHHWYDPHSGEWYCGNAQSEYHADFTHYGFYCPDYEGRNK